MQKSHWQRLAAMLTASLCLSASATVLQNFDIPEQRWEVEISTPELKVEYAGTYTISAPSSLRLQVPPAAGGDWPGIRLKVPKTVSDFSAFDRLVVDVINPSPQTVQLLLFLSDAGQEFNRGFQSKTIELRPGIHTRYVIDLKKAAEAVDLKRIDRISFSLIKPRSGADLHIDQLELLQPDEPAPLLSPAMGEQLKKLLPGASYLDGVRPPQAQALLYSFESPEEFREIKLVRPGEIDQSDRFPAAGGHTLHYRSPVQKDGDNEWRALEFLPVFEKKNWSGYDWLVFDVVNPTGKRHHTRFFITDSKTPFRSGFRSDGYDFEPYSYRRVVVPISRIAEKIDISDITLLHFIVHKPTGVDYELYLDNIHLLRPNDLSPAAPEQLMRSVIQMSVKNNGFSSAELMHILAEEEALFPETATGHQSFFAQFRKEIATLTDELNSPGLTPARFQELKEHLQQLPHRIRRVRSEYTALEKAGKSGYSDGSYAVGITAGNQKIPPRDVPFTLPDRDELSLTLARNEKEGAQVIVATGNDPLAAVHVSFDDLRSASGEIFPAAQITSMVVGSLKTTSAPSYQVPYVGYYPHVLLSYLHETTVAPHTAQSFFLKFHAPAEQQPGVYEGTGKVWSGDRLLREFPVRLKVNRFALPGRPVIPTAMSCGDDMRKMAMTLGVDWGRRNWEFAQFLADYGLEPDAIYRPTGPDFETMVKLQKRGKLSAFNLCSFEQQIKAKTTEEYVARAVERIRPQYDKAVELGLLPYAYVYGFDESPREKWPLLAACAAAIHREFPGLKVMTTTHDTGLGKSGLLGDVDIFCPVLNFYDPAEAEAARGRGRKVWWYVSASTVPPFPGLWVESDGNDMRALHGFMAAKFAPDGFLYYAINLWGENAPIEGDQPFLDHYNPKSFASLHGDGCLVYPGPEATPLPSFALEAIREGREDHACYRLLDAAVKWYQAHPEDADPNWLNRARSALQIPESLVKSTKQFNRSIEAMQAYRELLGSLLDELPALPFSPDDVVVPLQ